MYAPELETLDQLLGGDLPLTIIVKLFPSKEHFSRGVLGLLRCGDVFLLDASGAEITYWSWRELFDQGKVFEELKDWKLTLTPQGARKVG